MVDEDLASVGITEEHIQEVLRSRGVDPYRFGAELGVPPHLQEDRQKANDAATDEMVQRGKTQADRKAATGGEWEADPEALPNGSQEKLTPEQERAKAAEQYAETLRVRAMGKAIVEAEQTEAAEVEWVDVGAILDDGVEVPVPTLLLRDDGHGLAYAGRDLVLIGDPESGKTLVCAFEAEQVLRSGGSVAWIDVDHNGAVGTISRLIEFGVPPEVLRDPSRFRQPKHVESSADVLGVVAALTEWAPTLVVIDSIGEVVPKFDGASSLNADDVRRVHAAVVTPLILAGCAVTVVDHLPKGVEASAYGAAGSHAKRAVVDGTILRVKATEAFVRGRGGAATLTVVKDRWSGVKEHCPPAGKSGEALAGVFRILPGQTLRAAIYPGRRMDDEPPVKTDAELVAELPPERRTVRGVREDLKFGGDRASQALKTYREAQYLDGG